MVAELFESLLQELGNAMEIKDLQLDTNQTCLIRFPKGLEVYIEPHERDNFMLISANIGQVPAGRFREDVFREALKANGRQNRPPGIFAYSEQSDQLVMYEMLSLRELNGEKIASLLLPFIEKGTKWKTTLESGAVPLAETMTTGHAGGPGGLFGLRP